MCSVAGQCDTSRTGAPLYKTKRNAPDWAGNVDADAKGEGEGVESRTAIDRERGPPHHRADEGETTEKQPIDAENKQRSETDGRPTEAHVPRAEWRRSRDTR